MSLRPIDLQTMLVRLSELSREQSAIHDINVQSKAANMADSIRKTMEADEKVDQTNEIPDGVAKVDDQARQHEREQRQAAQAGGQEAPAAEEAPAPEDDIFHDPDLGTRIDISG